MTIFDSKVLNNFKISIEKGSFISIIGPIGCGKTFLLDEISKNIDNKFILSCVNDKKKFNSSIKEELYNTLYSYGVTNKETKSRIKRVLKQFNIYDYIYTDVKTLSDIDFKRFLLANALVTNPDVLIIDNLFAEFSRSETEEILKYLKKQCAKGMTVLFSTYKLDYCLFSDYVLVMNNYNILFFDKTMEVFKMKK